MSKITLSIIFLLGNCFLLSACSEPKEDLNKFIAQKQKVSSKSIPSIPQQEEYIPFHYRQESRSPFAPKIKNTTRNNDLSPDSNRIKEPLEHYPLDSLKIIGTLSYNNYVFALVKAPDNSIYRAKQGNYIGQNYGKIVYVSEKGIRIKEIVPNKVQGGYEYRDSELSAEENAQTSIY